MTVDAKFHSSVNTEHSLGKGEVDSSILSGSTRNPTFIGPFGEHVFVQSAVSGRTTREHVASIRGLSVEFDRHPFTAKEEPMTKAEALAEKIARKASDTLADLQREMDIMKWPAEFRAIMWGAVAHEATIRATELAKNGREKA